MENFTLWHTASDDSEVRFYATAVNEQFIHEGTDSLISAFLSDLGAADAEVSGWTLSPFVTDYLSDDRDSDAWEDVWFFTWDVRVQVSAAVELQTSGTGMAESTAYDETWTGQQVEPVACVVIADFDAQAREQLDGSPADHIRAQVEALDPKPSVEECGVPGQVHVSIPCDRSFLEAGAEAAVVIRDLCEESGATTHWRDAAD